MKFLRRFLLCAGACALAAPTRAQVPTWAKTTPAEITAAGIGVQITGADYGNSTFVLAAYTGGFNTPIVPAVYTSPDGTTWTRRTVPVTGGSVGRTRFLNGKFYLGMSAVTDGAGVPTGVNGAVLTSADGITWSAKTLGTPLFGPDDFAYGNGVYIGSAGSIGSSYATQIITSTDGVTWTPRTVATTTFASGLAFFSGKFYCTAQNPTTGVIGLYTSADGIAWARVTSAPTKLGELTASPAALIVNSSSIGNSVQALSTDGVTFTTATPGVPLAGGSIRYVNGAFVTPASLTSSGSIVYDQARASFDGRTWTTIGTTAPASVPTQDVREIAYGNGRYLFVGEFDVFTGTTTISPGGTSSGGGTTTPAPAITAQPAASQSIALGGSVTFTFTVTGTGITYQWFFNGVAISGAINFNYTIASVTAAHAGSYTVTATNAGGSVTSSASVLTVAAASNTARLSNVSIRAGAGSDSQTLIVGVTIGGAGTSGSKTLLVRGTGPALTAFGVPGALADPVLNIFSGTTSIASNDDWGSDPQNSAQVIAQGTALGAFPLTAGSKDSALVGTTASGGYTVQLTGKAGATGVGLVEVYDASSSFTTTTPRLTNVSARTQVGTGDNILITGFVVAGSGTRQVLIRATGPALAGFGVAGTLADPKLELYNGAGTKLDENDNWSASTTAAQTSVGAFPLTPGSKDSVLVATLAPGSYTAQVSGVGATSGVALVEIYELP